jgi:glycosyltransferase involved in cell wall biosynthesis
LDPDRLRLQVCFLKSIAGNPFEDPLRRQGIPCFSLCSRNLRDAAALRRLVRLVRQERIDLIHAHLTYAAIFGALTSRITGRPCVATLHVGPSSEPFWTRAGLRERLMCLLLERSAAPVVAVSEAVRESYARAGRLDHARIAVVHNGIECETFEREGERRDEVRRQLGLAPEAKAIIAVSALREGKGLEVVIEAARGVVAAAPETVFLIVGDGPLRGELAARAEAAGISPHVRWLGFRQDVPALLAASDVFVLPSLHDAFPTALLEAMAAGRAVVATAVGGIPEILDAPRTGRLVPPGDPDALSRALQELLAQPDEPSAMGEAARARARARFSSRVWVERLESVYARALGRGSA